MTHGVDRDEALGHAVEALGVAVATAMSVGAEVPPPPKRIAKGTPTVTLGSQAAAKVAAYRAMREARVHKAELARRLGVNRCAVDRLLDLGHATRLDRIDQALGVLGKRLDMDRRLCPVGVRRTACGAPSLRGGAV